MKTFLFQIILFATVINSHSQNTIKLYDINLKANEILGNGKVWGPNSGVNKTTTFTRATNYLDELLGQIYSTSDMGQPINFLNTEIEIYSPLLDSINFSYYQSYGFLRIQKKYPELLNDNNYKTFKRLFNQQSSNLKRREILFDDENSKFRNLLQESRISTYGPPISIKNTTSINKSVKAGIEAKIVFDIEEAFTVTPELKAALKDTISKHIELKNAIYHEIRLDDDYIKRAQMILSGIKVSEGNPQNEDFRSTYLDYFNSADQGIITGASVIEASFDAKKMKTINTAIGLTIAGSLKSSQDEQKEILGASADITAKYIIAKSIDSEIQTIQTFYYLRYVYDKRLELGAK